jgi:hypothetical protein
MKTNMYRFDIINYLIQERNYKSYLEVGTSTKINFLMVKCKVKECVEPAHNKNITYDYNMTSDEAFDIIKKKDKKYDIIFIDGLHLEHQLDKDIQNAINALNDNGVIVLHDCSPKKPSHASDPRHNKIWNGTCYKSFVKFRLNNPDISTCVVNTDYGCGILDIYRTQKPVQYILPLSKETLPNNHDKIVNGPIEIDDRIITWDYFSTNRKELLNLIEPKVFLETYSEPKPKTK